MIWRDFLEDEFPLGDGTAETAALAACPHCGESVELVLDPGSGARQEYVEDCPVCCQPFSVRVHYRPDGTAAIELDSAD